MCKKASLSYNSATFALPKSDLTKQAEILLKGGLK
jgi:hypothetical protein